MSHTDAAVSVLTIAGLVLAHAFGWLWMDPLAGAIGAFAIASWSYGLIRDTGRILMDVSPDERLERRMLEAIEASGDQVLDLHLWRPRPGHPWAIASVFTREPARGPSYYLSLRQQFNKLSHVTAELNMPSSTVSIRRAISWRQPVARATTCKPQRRSWTLGAARILPKLNALCDDVDRDYRRNDQVDNAVPGCPDRCT